MAGPAHPDQAPRHTTMKSIKQACASVHGHAPLVTSTMSSHRVTLEGDAGRVALAGSLLLPSAPTLAVELLPLQAWPHNPSKVAVTGSHAHVVVGFRVRVLSLAAASPRHTAPNTTPNMRKMALAVECAALAESAEFFVVMRCILVGLVTAAAAVLPCVAATGEPWPMVGANAAHTCVVDALGPTGPKLNRCSRVQHPPCLAPDRDTRPCCWGVCTPCLCPWMCLCVAASHG